MTDHGKEATAMADLVSACVRLDVEWTRFVEDTDDLTPVAELVGEIREALRSFKAASR